MADTASPLSAARLELLARRFHTAGVTGDLDVPVGSPATLSFGQQRLWFLDQLDPGAAAYNVSAAARIRGPVEPGILRSALTLVARRHAVLRARFDDEDGRPVQVIDDDRPVDFTVVDAARLGATAARAEAVTVDAVRRLASTPFDLRTGPLLRAVLYQLAVDDHILAVVVHHIACDGASAAVLVREVCSTCLALAVGRSPDLPHLPRQYWSYAELQQRQMRSGGWARQLDYWRTTLAGSPAALPLPEDTAPARAREPGRGPAARATRRLDRTLPDRLDQLAADAGATMFMTLLAGWQALLARHCGCRRVPVAVPVNTRSRAEFESLIGFFVNTLVIAGDTAGDPSFRKLLGRTRDLVVGALDHQDVPFEVVVRELNPPRGVGHEPLVQVLFSYQPEPPHEQPTGAVSFESLPVSAPVAKFSLSLYVSADADGLRATIEYDRSRWRPETIDAWLARYERLLLAAVADPDRPLSELAPETGARWTGPSASTVPGRVDQAVRQWAIRTPDSPAVGFGGHTVTYAELVAQADAYAAVLRQAGAGPERPVAVALPRAPRLVSALLAVLATGAPYLPIDPTHPRRRVTEVLSAAEATLCVVDKTTTGLLPADVARVDLDALPVIDDTAAPDRHGDLAYLMFTSGSTGQPKGVAVSHRSVLTLLASVAELVDAAPSDVTLGLTTVTFDISVLELFLPLTTGGCLVLADDAVRTDAVAIAGLMSAHGVTVAQATPTTWRVLLANGWTGDPSLRLLCGGEAMDDALAAKLRAAAGAVWNVYGPTETAIWSTASAVIGPPTLGTPLAGESVVLVGPGGAMVPPGTPGELCIGGSGLARGYWRQPAMTAERFVPDPFATRPGARMYRTGDVARQRRNGGLEFLGRMDDQLKLHGHRVEPGEVQAALARCVGVRAAAVVAVDGTLVGYAVADDSVAEQGLVAALAAELPAHLVPSRVELVEELPVTPAGKLDRRALTARARATRRAERAPRPGVEQLVAGVWGELLGRTASAEEDFFAAGGHSLLATQLARRLAEAAGVPVRVRDALEHPTVAGLARLIERLAAVPAPVSTDADPGRLSAGQQRLYFLQRLEPASTAYHVTLAARFAHELEPHALRTALDVLADRHAALQSAIVEADDGPRVVVDRSARIPLRVVDADPAPPLDEATVAELAAPELGDPFSLDTAPLARVALIRAGARQCAVVLVLHHVIADGWSARVLVDELARAYRGELTRARRPLPRPAEQPVTPADLERVRARLAGFPQALDAVAETTPHAAGTAGRLRVDLPVGLADVLARYCAQHAATAYPVALAAWALALSRLAAQSRLLLGTPYARRDQPGTEAVVGLLATTLVVAADTSGHVTFTALVRRIQHAVVAALADADVPFDAVVADFAPERDLTRTPLFQAMYSLETSHEIEPDGWRALRVGSEHAKTTVALWLTDGPLGLGGEIEYDAGVMSRATARTLAEEFTTILAGAMEAPTARTSTLGRPVTTATGIGAPAASTVIDVLNAVRRRSPTVTAIEAGDEAVTYAELWECAGRLAGRLRRERVAPGQPVGLLARPGVGTYVAVVGILRSGAVYAPLDPEAPQAWRDELSRCSGVTRVLDADTGAPEPTDAPPPTAPGGEWGAYLIHTSGSSGRPKGVLVPHRALALFAVSAARAYGLRADDRVLQFAALSFDASLEELFATWAAGATVVTPPPAARESIVALLDFVTGARITVLDLPTAFWHELVVGLRAEDLRLPACVRLVILGGEPVRPDRVADWLATAPHVKLVDSYGPTEATVVATVMPMTTVDAAGQVGEPLPGVRVYLMRADGQLAAPGQRGEICLGGGGVAHGYLGDPRRTADAFRPDPFTSTPGTRMYRTGDLAHRDAHGAMRYLGRRDRELKVRGFRVDPAVVETALEACPEVVDSYVTEAGGSLAAVVVPTGDVDVDGPTLRRRLAARLPAHLVPVVIGRVAAMPLTRHGKVDVHAVRAAVQPAAVAATDTTPSADPAVETMQAVWAQLFEHPVSATDDFFTLGGHSLLALRLVRAVRATWQRDVPVRAVFEAPTPARLVTWLRRTGRADGPGLPPLAVLDERSGPLSVAQARIWRAHCAQPDTSRFTMVVTARVDVPLDPTTLATAMTVLAARHSALRWRVRPDSADEPRFVLDDAEQPIDFYDLQHLPAPFRSPALTDLVARQRQRRFDLADEAPFALTLVRLDAAQHVLILAAHHLVSDAGSIDVLFDELAAVYLALATDAATGLAPRGPSAGDYAVWEHAALAGGAFDAQRAFWRERLARPLAPLPLAATDPSAPLVHDRAVRMDVVGDDLADARRLAAGESATLFTTVLALLMRAVAEESGAADVRVATMTANREDDATAGMVGLLANTIVIRAQVDAGASLERLVADVRTATLDAFDHQQVPFEVVLADLGEAVEPSELAPVLLLWNRVGRDGSAAATRVTPSGLTAFQLIADVTELPDRLDVTLTHAATDGGPHGALGQRVLDRIGTALRAAAGTSGGAR